MSKSQRKCRRHTATRQQWDRIEGDEGWGCTEIRKALLDLQCSVELLNELNVLSGKPSILEGQSINDWPEGQMVESSEVKDLCREALALIADLYANPHTLSKTLDLNTSIVITVALQKAIELL